MIWTCSALCFGGRLGMASEMEVSRDAKKKKKTTTKKLLTTFTNAALVSVVFVW
jgi:hypothetical protein